MRSTRRVVCIYGPAGPLREAISSAATCRRFCFGNAMINEKRRQVAALQIAPLTELFLEDSCKLLGIASNRCLILAFDHHSHKILRARITHQQPAARSQSFIYIGQSCLDSRNRVERWLARNSDVDYDLRKAF